MRGLLLHIRHATHSISLRVPPVTSVRLFCGSSVSRFSGWATQDESSQEPVRKTGKPLFSRKTFLVDYYKYMNDTNEIILYIHHNNLMKADTLKIRSQLQKLGVQLLYLRNNIYNIYLRSANEEDPALLENSLRNRDVVHPLSVLLSGPTAVIAIKNCDPPLVDSVLKTIKPFSDKLILMGARVDTAIYNPGEVNEFKDLPTKEQLQAQLASMLAYLGGAGLVRTLDNKGTTLYLTLEQRRKDMNPSSAEKMDDNL